MVDVALFELGQLVATPGALDVLAEHAVQPLTLVRRHLAGDWGQICVEDRSLNEQVLRSGDRLLSVYDVASGVTGWLITNGVGDDGHRDTTTILLPDQY